MADPNPPPSREASIDALEAQLDALGAESETERAVKRIAPWVASLVMHAGMVVLGFLLTWTVVLLNRDDEPTLIVADFNDMVYDPLMKSRPETTELVEELVQDRVPTETLAEDVEDPFELDVEPVSFISDASRDTTLAQFAPDPTLAKATFVGLSSTNARRVVYVIDASGSMIRSLPIVLDELARSLDGLGPEQLFSVVFFQRNQALVVPPVTRLIPATAAEKGRVLAWIKERVIPSGRSNPLTAIERALSFKPDVIFMLSENITGSGEFEIDQTDLLALLDRLNPADPGTGRRPTQINCIQFLDPDPLDTLRRIAEAHGGARSYKFLDREELGLRAP